MTSRTALVLFGTRPEAIKIAPVVFAMQESSGIEPVVAVTAQHREMLDQVLDLFGIRPAFDLDLMRQNQTLAELTARIIAAVGPVIRDVRPDVVVVQGDTTTTFAGALSAFYEHTPVAHVEAGYRTNDRYLPFPEEINRRLVSELADIHFAANDACSPISSPRDTLPTASTWSGTRASTPSIASSPPRATRKTRKRAWPLIALPRPHDDAPT